MLKKSNIKKIELSNFPYGKVTKSLREAVKWLNRRKASFTAHEDGIDFPDYWGMPKRVSCRLSSDDVDFLQTETYNWREQDNDFDLDSGDFELDPHWDSEIEQEDGWEF